VAKNVATDSIASTHSVESFLCERTTSEQSGSRLIGGDPSVPMSFDVELSAASPIWDLFAATEMNDLYWAGDHAAIHHEQNTSSRGTLTVDGHTWSVGVGFRGHSTGPRDFTKLGSDRFWGLVSPTTGRGVQGIMVWDRDGQPELATAAYNYDETVEIVNGEIALNGVASACQSTRELGRRPG
jgi:hypothetical protein